MDLIIGKVYKDKKGNRYKLIRVDEELGILKYYLNLKDYVDDLAPNPCRVRTVQINRFKEMVFE